MGAIVRAPAAGRLLPVYADVAAETVRLLRHHQIRHPREHVRLAVAFADGTCSTVYRETVRVGEATVQPTLVVVQFQLRLVGGSRVLHAAFRAESLLNTLLFAGFVGFRSKLWLTDLDTGVYRGVYEWDGEDAARRYTAALCPLLELVSTPGSVRAHHTPGVRRDAFLGLAGPAVEVAGDGEPWWQGRAVP